MYVTAGIMENMTTYCTNIYTNRDTGAYLFSSAFLGIVDPEERQIFHPMQKPISGSNRGPGSC